MSLSRSVSEDTCLSSVRISIGIISLGYIFKSDLVIYNFMWSSIFLILIRFLILRVWTYVLMVLADMNALSEMLGIWFSKLLLGPWAFEVTEDPVFLSKKLRYELCFVILLFKKKKKKKGLIDLDDHCCIFLHSFPYYSVFLFILLNKYSIKYIFSFK